MCWISASLSHAAPFRTGRAAWPRRPSGLPPSPAPGLSQVRCCATHPLTGIPPPKQTTSEPVSRPKPGTLLQCTVIRHCDGRPRRRESAPRDS